VIRSLGHHHYIFLRSFHAYQVILSSSTHDEMI